MIILLYDYIIILLYNNILILLYSYLILLWNYVSIYYYIIKSAEASGLRACRGWFLSTYQPIPSPWGRVSPSPTPSLAPARSGVGWLEGVAPPFGPFLTPQTECESAGRACHGSRRVRSLPYTKCIATDFSQSFIYTKCILVDPCSKPCAFGPVIYVVLLRNRCFLRAASDGIWRG